MSLTAIILSCVIIGSIIRLIGTFIWAVKQYTYTINEPIR
jgi:hypothetical protein